MSKSISELFSYDDASNRAPLQILGDGKVANSAEVSSAKTVIRPDAQNTRSPQYTTTGELVLQPENQNPRFYTPRKYMDHISRVADSIQLIADTASQYKLFKEDPLMAQHILGKEVTFALAGIGKDALHNGFERSALNGGLFSWSQASYQDSDGSRNVEGVAMLPPDMSDSDKQIINSQLQNIAYYSKFSDVKKAVKDVYLQANELNNCKVDEVQERLGKENFKNYGKPVTPTQPKEFGEKVPGLDTFEASEESIDKLDSRGLFESDNVFTDYQKYRMESKDPLSTDDRGATYIPSKESNPYYEFEGTEIKVESIEDARKLLREQNLLSSYRNYAGFEIGTNHLWRIRIRPYESWGHSELTCVPPLPAYIMPDLWSGDYSGNWMGKNNGVLNLGNASMRWFSYSEFTPVLSYDLNFGSLRTDQIKLFNGQMDMITGMNYNLTMNMSILDDVFGSMTKYMATYINCIYDQVTNSCAPYYNSCFEIELTILRSGGAINHQMKFIAIPIEYAPRFEGSQEANEVRVDVTFGIIGFIAPAIDKKNKPSISRQDVVNGRWGSPDDLSMKTYGDKYGAKAVLLNTWDSMPASDMTWKDVVINPGISYDVVYHSKGSSTEFATAKEVGTNSAVFGHHSDSKSFLRGDDGYSVHDDNPSVLQNETAEESGDSTTVTETASSNGGGQDASAVIPDQDGKMATGMMDADGNPTYMDPNQNIDQIQFDSSIFDTENGEGAPFTTVNPTVGLKYEN